MTRIPVITVYTNDTGPTMKFSLAKSDGSGALNLAGATVKCLLRLQGSTVNLYTGSSTDCTITDAPNGVVSYNLPSAITDPGFYTGQLAITFSGGQIQRSQRFTLEVTEGIAAT